MKPPIKDEDVVYHNGKVYIPPALRQTVLDWYHTMLVYPGETRMERSIRTVYTWKVREEMSNSIAKTLRLVNCSRNKEGKSKVYYLLIPLEPANGRE